MEANSPPKKTTGLAMVINGDQTQLQLLSGLLTNSGLEVQRFVSAMVALESMDRGLPPDLIVTDLAMPDIDGWRFCRLLRSPEYAPFNRVPILIVSATVAGEEAARITADLGANGFLALPVDGQEFEGQVRMLLRGEQSQKFLRVLIVEDDPDQAGVLKGAFEAHGYRADIALTGHEAERSFKTLGHDVVVLDHHLPDMRGADLLAMLKLLRPDTVYLAMTADPRPELALEWMKQGAAAFVSKPFAPQYLIELCAKARGERELLRLEDRLQARTRELRESEEKFRRAFRLSPDAIVLNRAADGVYLDINEGFTAITGYARDDVLGRSSVPGDLGIWVNAEDRDRLLASLKDHGEVIGFEAPFRCKDRRVIFGLMSARIIHIQGEDCILSITRDITERKRVQEALERSEQNYREIFNSTNEAILLHDATTGRLLDVNDAMLRLYGYDSKDEVLARSIEDLCGNEVPYTQQEALRHIRLAIEAGPQVFEWPARNKSGEQFWVEVSLRSSQIGGQGRILAVVRDIAERKRAEAEREKLQSELTQVQKMESVGRLAGGVAHDFNNMLTVIQGHASLALTNLPTHSPLRENLEEIQKSAQRSADLTRQLLAFARKQTVAPKVLDLNVTLEGMLKMLRRLIGEDIELVWLPAPDLWPVKIDPSQIDQVLANLCVNARAAISGVGKITIATENVVFDEAYCATHAGFLPGEYVLLAVSDDGCGMNKDVIEHLFEPFFTTKGAGKGTGLGLATVYGIVKQNHGIINVHSEPGHGTTFKICLPPHADKAPQMQNDGLKQPVGNGHETLLLVEDELAVLGIGKRTLESVGYTVLAASTPSEAIGLAKEYAGKIHLLMSDVVMPEMNGRDLAKRLLSLYPNLKCLFMSGYTADVMTHHGVLDEGIHFIQKPFSAKDLTEKIRKTLDDGMDSR